MEEPEEFDTGDPDELIIHHWSPEAKAILQRFYRNHWREAELLAELEQGYVGPRRPRPYPCAEENPDKRLPARFRETSRVRPQLEVSRVYYEVITYTGPEGRA